MKNTKIDWADATWNPVTGCLHGCAYCYAREMTRRFGGFLPEENGAWNRIQYEKDGPRLGVLNEQQKRMQKNGKIVAAPYPFDFEPTLHRYRLDEPQHWKKPSIVFVCSMADLFGAWVPDEWIKEVFAACEAAPQHTYLFLTKNPKRYAELARKGILQFKPNFWFGSTVTTNDSDIYSPSRRNIFASVEPIHGPIDFSTLGDQRFKWMPKWVIIGAETGNRKEKIVPQREWIDSIVEQAHRQSAKVFMKESLLELMGGDFLQETPW